MRHYSAILLLISYGIFFQPGITHSQDSDDGPDQYIGELIESLSENGIETDDLSTLFDDLENYRQNPININSAGYDQLKSLYVLNDYQIAALIDYRQGNGPLLSLYELIYIPGYREEDIQHIQPFVYCGQPDKSSQPITQAFKYPKQQITFRYQQIIEQQEGYKNVPDSVLELNPDKSRYLGNPAKFYTRYSFKSNAIRAGIIAEKDPGEEFFNGSNRQGFDFYSAYAAYSNTHLFLKNVLIGDYNIRLGQGLLAWSSYSFGLTSDLSNMNRSTERFQGNTSVEENRFLRGAALTVGWEKIELSCFASGRQIDASLADTTVGENLFISLTETGYHATPLDLEKEDVLHQITYGASIRLNLKKVKLDLNGLNMHYDMDCIGGKQLYQRYGFRGNTLTGTSLDYRIILTKAQFFGESAYSFGHFATLNGLLLFLKPEISIGILQRHYDKKYYSYYSNAFCENSSVSNENGFYLGTEMQFNKTWCRMYADVFSFPWLRYGVNAPSAGYKAFLDCGRKINRAEISFRFEYREKPENSIEEDHIYDIQSSIKDKYRINSKLPLGSHLNLQNRMEIARVAQKNQPECYGYFISQDLLINKLQLPLQLDLRLSYFNAANYDARIYAYERDVYSGGSSQMLYGKGWRYIVLIRWDASDHFSLRLKFAQSLYPGIESIGSGLNAIEGDHRTEIKVQLFIRIS
jgi:hypothetical protein